jgi:endonuclease/exonuclease/phosphatase family metal-dependent hydrolase
MTPFPFHAWLLAALSAATLAAQQAPPEHTFRVGTWNLEFLGAEGNFRNNTPPRTDDDYAAIGKKVVQLGVCVLAVQEINDEASLRKVAAGAGASWDVLLGTSGSWDDGKTAQRIGFVFDKAQVELLHAEELLQLPRKFEEQPIFHRVPVTACFQHKASGCDFRLVTVHMKAGQKAQDQRKRVGEAQALAAWLDTLAADANEDPDVVLLGDFNSSYGTDPEKLFEKSERRRYLEPREKQPTIMHFADPIDQVVGSVGCKELRVDSLAIDGDFDGMKREAWRQTYSDHFPVVATFVASGDDDAKAKFARGPASQFLPRAAAPAAGAPK